MRPKKITTPHSRGIQITTSNRGSVLSTIRDCSAILYCLVCGRSLTKTQFLGYLKKLLKTVYKDLSNHQENVMSHITDSWPKLNSHQRSMSVRGVTQHWRRPTEVRTPQNDEFQSPIWIWCSPRRTSYSLTSSQPEATKPHYWQSHK